MSSPALRRPSPFAAPPRPEFVELGAGSTGSTGSVSKTCALAARPKPVDVLGVDLDDHPLFAGTEIGISILAQVLLREQVHVLKRALLNDLGAAAHRHVASLLVRCREDGDRRSRVALDVLDLCPALGTVDEHVRTVVVNPYGCHMR